MRLQAPRSGRIQLVFSSPSRIDAPPADIQLSIPLAHLRSTGDFPSHCHSSSSSSLSKWNWRVGEKKMLLLLKQFLNFQHATLPELSFAYCLSIGKLKQHQFHHPLAPPALHRPFIRSDSIKLFISIRKRAGKKERTQNIPILLHFFFQSNFATFISRKHLDANSICSFSSPFFSIPRDNCAC